MNIEKLEVGRSFKNYKELCAEMGWEVKASVGTKNAQFKELARYCHFTKIGHRITITEVYDEPQEKEDGRGKSEGSRRNSTIYGELVQLLILDLLASSPLNYITISRSKLMLKTSIVNGNYTWCGQHPKKLADYTNIEVAIVYDFFNTSRSSLKGVIETALKHLQDKRIIMFDTVTKVPLRDTKFHRLATPKEKDVIMLIEKSVLDELGYETFSQVRFSKDWITYKNKVKFALHDETNIDYHYQAYEIVANKKYSEQEAKNILDYLLKETEKEEIKDELNYKVQNNMGNNAEKRQEYGFVTSGKRHRGNEHYAENIKELIRLMISQSADNIVPHIMSDDELDEDQMEAIDSIFI